jgi:mannitol/fructose-specific phosphotransferase system IIA component (Ntr-type)
MGLSDYLAEDRIVLNFTAKSKDTVLTRLADIMAQSCKLPDSAIVKTKLQEREELGSTGIGRGIALPHAQVPGAKHLFLGAAIAPNGVLFDSLDGEPVKLLFCLIASAGTDKSYLGVLAHLARILRDESNINRMLECKSSSEFIDILNVLEA